MSGPFAGSLITGQQGGAGCRVLHVNSGNLYGGVESILTTLARLRDLCPGMEPHYAVCHEGRLSAELRQSGVQVYNLGNVRISRPWTVWRARRRLREVLDRAGFDLVICHMPWSLAVFGPTVNAAGQRLAFWAHAYHEGTGWLERLARRAKPDLAIANSRYTEGGIGNVFPAVPRVVIYPPVPLEGRRDIDECRARIRKQLGADENAVVVIQVSRIEACKGHVHHLEALAALKDLKTAWTCWMVGGAQRLEEARRLQELLDLAKTLGIEDRVQFLGQRSDVAELLSAADLYCQPNLTPDSFGITFVEALWAERPVITSAIGGALEVIDDSCGVQVPAADTKLLAEALKRMIEDQGYRQRLGEAGPVRAKTLCNPKTQITALYQVARNSVAVSS